MKSKDLMKEHNVKLMQSIKEAMEANDEEKMTEAFQEFATGVQQAILDEYQELRNTNDSTILAARGIRQLTSEEREYYQMVIDAGKSNDYKQALSNIDRAMPETIIDQVIDDMKEAHPLLDSIDMINCQGAIKMITNAGNLQLATWGALTSKIATELAGSIDVSDMTQAKLSAFIPVPKDLLDLGPSWLDNYVRIILSEATAGGLEQGIVKGTGKNQPVGMCKDLNGEVIQGVYSDKKKKVLKNIEPVEYCKIVSNLAKKPGGGYRIVPEILFICNPVDYISKVVPATTVRDSDGNYKNNIFPYPTKPVQTIALDEGEAIIGIQKKYFMGLGAGKSGKMEADDSYQFLEDNRVYLVKLYGMGKPMDNNAFEYLDISKLVPSALQVMVVNTASTDPQETPSET